METLSIPHERIAVLIGKEGAVKRQIEARGRVKLDISGEGDVEITGEPYAEWRAKDVVRAIGRGFSPEKALKLFNEDFYIKIIDLKEMFGSEKEIKRYIGRVVGKEGKAKRIIEDVSGADVCIYGSTISIIGELAGLKLAGEAIAKLLKGASHPVVYRFLEKERRKIREQEATGIWE